MNRPVQRLFAFIAGLLLSASLASCQEGADPSSSLPASSAEPSSSFVEPAPTDYYNEENFVESEKNASE